MSDTAENATSRLWRDRAQIREQERDEAQGRARVAEEKVAALTEENDRLADTNMQLSEQNDRLAAEIQSRARVAEETVAALTEENDRLADKNMQLSEQNDRLAAEIARLSFENDRLAEIARLRASS